MTASLHSPASRLTRWCLATVLLGISLFANAQQDPPTRAARLTAHQGTVSFSPAGDDSWYDNAPNRPLTAGDRLWTDRGARAELHIGATAVRMDEQTLLEFSELDDDTLRMTVQQGTLQLRLREDMAGDQVEVDTGNLAFVPQTPGEYLIDADPAADLTRVAVASGNAVLYGENGVSQPLGARQQVGMGGRALRAVAAAPLAEAGFERWVAERNRLEDQSVSARYVSREVVGYQQLDAYGDWRTEDNYGPVWYPRDVAADWAPYSEGNWVDIAPWGLTWVDNAPWGFAPSHYGRWARVGSRWGWVPGQRDERPVYAPALVGFLGGAGSALAIGNGRNGVGWFPLAPGEAWRPSYRASQRYIDQVNRTALGNRAALRGDGYAYQRVANAVTVVPSDRFGNGPIRRRDAVRLPNEFYAGAQLGSAPTLPGSRFAPGTGRAPGGFAGRPAASTPPMVLAQQGGFDRQREQNGSWRSDRGQRDDARRQGNDGGRQQERAQRQAIEQQQLQQQQLQQQQQNQQFRQAQQLQQAQQQQLTQAQQAQQFELQRIQRQQERQQQRSGAQNPTLLPLEQQQLQLQQQALQAQQRQMQQAAQAGQMQQAAQMQQAQRAAQQQQQLQMQQQSAMRQAQEGQQRAAQQQMQQAQQAQAQMAMQMQQAQQAAMRQAQQQQQQQLQRQQQGQPRMPGSRGMNQGDAP